MLISLFSLTLFEKARPITPYPRIPVQLLQSNTCTAFGYGQISASSVSVKTRHFSQPGTAAGYSQIEKTAPLSSFIAKVHCFGSVLPTISFSTAALSNRLYRSAVPTYRSIHSAFLMETIPAMQLTFSLPVYPASLK